MRKLPFAICHLLRQRRIRLGRTFAIRKFNLQAGFTVVELLVVFAIFFVTTTAATVAFGLYSKSQTLDNSSKGVVSFLNSTRINATTQAMLGSCTQHLKKYSVRFTLPSTYEMLVYCNDNYGYAISTVLKKQTLPDGIKFDTFNTGTSTEISFEAGSGISGGGYIRLKGSDQYTSKMLQIDPMGNITEQYYGTQD